MPRWLLRHRHAGTWLLSLAALAGVIEAAVRSRSSIESAETLLDLAPWLCPALAVVALLLVHGRRRIALPLLSVCAVGIAWSLAGTDADLDQAWLSGFGGAAACLGLATRLLRPRPALLATATAAGSVLLLLGLIAAARHLGLSEPISGADIGWSCVAVYLAIAALLLPPPSLDGWRPSARWLGAAATLGLVSACIAAWWLGADPLLRLGTAHPPIPMTLLVCLLLIAIALLEWRRSAAWLIPPLLVVAPLALLVLFDEFSSEGITLARWLSRVETGHAGMPLDAMAASSAITLLVATTGLLSLQLRERWPSILVVGWLAGALMAAAALIVLSGYALDLTEVRAWGMDSPMTPMAAVCFLLLGAGLAASDWHTERVRGQRVVVIPLIVGLAGTAVSLGLWMELQEDARRVRAQASAQVLDGMARAVEISLENRIRGFLRLGYRLRRDEAAGAKPDFREYAADYFSETSPLRGLALLDASGAVLAEHHGATDPTHPALSRIDASERRRLARLASATGEPQASNALPWGDASIFMLVVPVGDGGQPPTLIASTYEVDAHLAYALRAHSGDYRAKLAPASAGSGPSAPQQSPWVRELDLLGQHWRIEYMPPPGTYGSALPASLLVAGLVASVLLSIALHLAALARRRAAEAQAALEDRQRVFEGSRDVICTLDAQGRFLEANPAAGELWGRAPAALVGRPYLDLVLPEDADMVRASFDAAVAGEATTGLAHRCLRSDGRTVHVEWSLQWLAESQRLVGLVRDVTERVAYEQRLMHTMDDLSRKNRELQEFAYVASHDLQEPLRKVRSFAERVLERAGPGLDENNRDYLRRANSAAERMQTLIHDLLEFTRVESRGRAFLPVALAEVVEGVQSDLEQALEASGGRIACGELPVIEADPTQMRQVFQNILSNALKFRRPDATPQISIDVTAERHGDRDGYRIVITDNGIGFEAHHAEEIFAPFKRLHGRSAFEGTGIGLAIVRRIIERHGGAIAASSQPGQGAAFTMWLPRCQANGLPKQ